MYIDDRPFQLNTLQLVAKSKATKLLHDNNNKRLPSNLRPTTRECVYLVARGHCWSHEKDGGHTILSDIADNPILRADITALSSIEPELLPIKVLHCENREFRASCSCDLDFVT